MGIATARRTMIKSWPIVIMELKISKPLSIDRPFDILPKSPRRSPSEDSIIARIIVFQKMILQTLSKNALTFGDFLNKIQKMQTRTRTKTMTTKSAISVLTMHWKIQKDPIVKGRAKKMAKITENRRLKRRMRMRMQRRRKATRRKAMAP